ncbi:MAG TPA: permease [Firmicutes bacterium]|nr:permease [Bacillota bacterium]
MRYSASTTAGATGATGSLRAFARVYRYFLLIILLDTVILILRPLTGKEVFRHTYSNFIEMLSICPPIFLLLGLLDVWVPRETIIRYLGEDSGVLGAGLSILLGAAAAGPLYGAFPIAAVMMKKGAKFSNILIFIGAWSTLKVPMFLFEASALGARFAVTRWIVSLTGIVFMTLIIDRIVTKEEKAAIYHRHGEGCQT